jgi:GT2 family glycosyltransferase
MELSVIVTHYHEPQLKDCLKTLKNSLVGIKSEIIVVMSEYKHEELEGFLADFPDITFLPFKENLFFVRTANRGIEKAKGDFILIINADVIVSEEAVESLINFLRNNQDVGLAGPRILYPDNSEQPSAFRFYSPLTVLCRRSFLGKVKICRNNNERFLYKDIDFSSQKEVNVDWLSNGAGVMARREYIEKIGLLDERFCHYFSDVDWCRRFWQKGLRVVYFPRVSFYHYHGKRSAGGIMSLLKNKITRIHLLDGIKYFLKWGIKAPKIN